MNLDLTEEQSILREAVRRFAEEELKPSVGAIEKAGAPSRKILSQMGELGFTGMLVPVEHGGADTDTLSFILVIAELAGIHASTAVALLIHSLAAALLCSLGSKEQSEQWMQGLLEGSQLATLALAEDGSNFSLEGVRSIAQHRDGAYRLNGHKSGVPLALSADVGVLFAVCEQVSGTPGEIGLFWVPVRGRGISVSQPAPPLGLRGLGMADLTLENCELPEEYLIGTCASGEALHGFRDLFRIGTAAVALGLADSARKAAAVYARERRQFGRPIIQFQAIEFMLSDMSTEVEATRQLLYRAAWLRDQERESSVAAAQLRLFGTASARRATNKALQIHGGYGYLGDYPVERYFRDARSLELLEEVPEVQRQTISEPLLAGLEDHAGGPVEEERSGS